ncbi:MAG: hypothetical protein RLY71_3745 [Pseudomonadota bacterium]|jgi:hypothetical protein
MSLHSGAVGWSKSGRSAQELFGGLAAADVSPRDWLRRAEQALAEGDLLQCGELLMVAADDCLVGQDADEAHWHLQRALRVLDHAPTTSRRLMLRCQLAERLQTLAQAGADHGERGATRRLCEQARDLGFEIVGGAERLEHLGQRAGLLLRVAELFDAMGDQAEAQALRERTFGALGTSDASSAPLR